MTTVDQGPAEGVSGDDPIADVSRGRWWEMGIVPPKIGPGLSRIVGVQGVFGFAAGSRRIPQRKKPVQPWRPFLDGGAQRSRGDRRKDLRYRRRHVTDANPAGAIQSGIRGGASGRSIERNFSGEASE